MDTPQINDTPVPNQLSQAERIDNMPLGSQDVSSQPDKEEFLDLDEETLKILGDEPLKSQEELKIHIGLANRWNPWLQQGLKKEIRNELLRKYPRVDFCSLEPPILNQELSTLNPNILKKDRYFTFTQNLAGSALLALAPVITDLVSRKTAGSRKMLENLWDAAQLLAEIQHSQTIARKAYILPSVSKQIAEQWVKRKQLFNEIWKTEKIPEDWQASIIHPIHKKGDILACENYRGISLLNAAYKIFTSIVKERLEPYAEEILGEYQAGFRRGRSTSDQLFVVRQIAEKFWEFDIDLHHVFVDFKQVYDSISREKLHEILQEFRIPPKLVRIIQATMKNTRGYVRISGELTTPFQINRRLKQGDGLASMLFNLALEHVVRKTRIDVRSTIMYKSVQLAGYVNDIDILERSIISIKETFLNIEEAAMGIKINTDTEETKI
ncbi:hypothetical protein DMN91_008751 [Ooceraea biroi]|uniref:Reverse transcriptase domain-containing protein n=1 Tax=Ooceraea biroi TaxID=2015173 RepID=A0A3L8DDC8_OOCBI|nr:hypothetical protein DMN91_008751 [Ooceraea biroi]